MPPDQLNSYGRLASKLTVPLATGEFYAGLPAFEQLIKHQSARILQPEAPRCGGISEWRRIAKIALEAGLSVCPCWFHDIHAQLAPSTANVPMIECFPTFGVLNFGQLINQPLTQVREAYPLRSARPRFRIRHGYGQERCPMTGALAQTFPSRRPPSDRKLLRDGLVVDVKKEAASRRHILIGKDGHIEALFDGAVPAIDDAETLDCSHFIVAPGLVNAHTHSQGSLARALGDRISLEHLLNAGSWFNHYRTIEDLHLSAMLGAAEMVRGGCTTCYDLTTEVPVATVEGMSAVASAYAEIGMRHHCTAGLEHGSLYDVVDGLEEIPHGAPTSESDRARPDAAGQLRAINNIARRWSHASRNVRTYAHRRSRRCVPMNSWRASADWQISMGCVYTRISRSRDCGLHSA